MTRVNRVTGEVVEDELDGKAQQFLDVLRSDDELLEACGQHLMDVVEALKHTGGKGTVTLTLQMTQPKKKGQAEQIWIEGKVKSTSPSPEHEQHMFYAVDGQLTRRDPRQPELPTFKTVAGDESAESARDEQTAGG